VAELEKQPRAEIIRNTPFDYFLGLVLDSLRPKPNEPASVSKSSSDSTIYLACISGDISEARPLVEGLRERGLVVMSARAKPEEHRERLRAADRVLIYWGLARERQIGALLLDARKEEKAVLVYIGPPDTAEKQEFEAPGVRVIHADAERILSGIDQIEREFLGEDDDEEPSSAE
jgi:hypothetical protein